MTISEAWTEIIQWIETYMGNTRMLVLALASFAYLCVFQKDARKRIIAPILLIIVVVVNPVLYKLMYYDIVYWRLFWMLPDSVVIGMTLVDLCGKLAKSWQKCAGLLASTVLIILLGNNVFLPESGRFVPADSPYKISPEARKVCEVILKDNPTPKIIMAYDLYCETRQYSGDIYQLFGRDRDGYIIKISKDVKKLVNILKKDPSEWDPVIEYAIENDYTHLCFYNWPSVAEKMEEYGFEALDTIGVYTIYRNLPG